MNKEKVVQKVSADFELAFTLYKDDSQKSVRLVKNARKLAQKYQVRLPSSLQRKYCHQCYQILIPSVNCTIRSTNSCIVYTCLDCKGLNKFRIKS